MKRKLIAALACRAGGSRLYGKPLQNLAPNKMVLDHILEDIFAVPEIDETVLGISEGKENFPFVDVAQRHHISYIFGSEKDVLWRLVLCGRAGKATDIFRITTECPFIAWELLSEVWQRHCEDENDITVTDFLPEGLNFEIYSQDALERMHEEGNDSDRSEFCSAYPRRCPDRFKIGLVEPPDDWKRLDLRFTVDYPEDLILCRDIYSDLKEQAPHISTGDIIQWVATHPEHQKLVEPYVVPEPLWAHTIRYE
jgi:spore coat polysaccharide biosynthesis protein SpsF